MKSSKLTAPVQGLVSQYNDLRQDAAKAADLLPHQQSTPNLTLKVESGICFIGGAKVVYAGGNSPSFTAPVSNPRIDLLVMDNAGTLSLVAGTEAASPSVPSYPVNKLVVCEVYNRVGQTGIYDEDTSGQGYIYRDVRPYLQQQSFKQNSGIDEFGVASSPANELIAHGLGKVPTKVKITGLYKTASGSVVCISVGLYNGTSASVIYNNNLGTTIKAAGKIAKAYYSDVIPDYAEATITVDATNITLSWTKTGSPSGVITILWEAEG